ncbi:hypothetical protein MRX96_047192 [Rhipicephalus microplus]
MHPRAFRWTRPRTGKSVGETAQRLLAASLSGVERRRALVGHRRASWDACVTQGDRSLGPDAFHELRPMRVTCCRRRSAIPRRPASRGRRHRRAAQCPKKKARCLPILYSWRSED